MPERDHLQRDATALQTNGHGGVNIIYGKGMELENVTPAKVCQNIEFNQRQATFLSFLALSTRTEIIVATYFLFTVMRHPSLA